MASAQDAQNAPAAAGYRISGRVVSAESGAPLAGAEVAIVVVPDGAAPLVPQPLPGGRQRRGRRLPTASQSEVTAEDGSFAFEQVSAGKYSLQASHRGYITAAYQQHGNYSTAIVTGPGAASEHLTLKLSAGAVISGTVTDGSGDPVEQANVSLYRQEDDGLGSIRLFRGGQANDLGAYEFAHLPPGTYFVSAAGRVWYANAGGQQVSSAPKPVSEPAVNLDVAYPRTYYADASDSAAATPIPVRGGERLRTDLHLQAVPAVHIHYTLPAIGPEAHSFQRPPMLAQSVFGQSDPTITAFSTISNGFDHGQQSLSVSVAPGEYDVEIDGRSLNVNASGDVQLDSRSGAPTVEFSGRLASVAGAELPDPVYLSLQSAGNHPGGQMNTPVSHDGSFRFDRLRPGLYELEVGSAGRPLAVVQAAVSGAQLTGNLLRVGSQAVTLAATVTPAMAIVAGVAVEDAAAREPTAAAPVQDRAPAANAGAPEAEPASGVMIVLIPEYTAEHALYRRDQSDSDGTFSLRDCAPGRYTAIAIRDGWDLDWAQPEVIRRYLRGGEAISVKSTGTTRLLRPLIVQQR